MRKREFSSESRNDPHFPWLEIHERFTFPDPEEIEGSVVGVGGNLSPGMLISAYTQGVFPWFNENDPLLWQSPDPRFVIFPETFHIPKRLRRSLKTSLFEIKTDTAFEKVVNYCSIIDRQGQQGSWITDDMIEAFLRMHTEGFAHSVETWYKNTLIGGFYGILIGPIFCGESMFTRVPDASKIAFAVFAQYFFSEMGGKLIDSQVYTDHIARFGGLNISRTAYLRKLIDLLGKEKDLSSSEQLIWPLTIPVA